MADRPLPIFLNSMQQRHSESKTLDRPLSPPLSKPSVPSPEPVGAREVRPKPAEQKRASQKPIEFRLHAPQASSVVVAGSFNNWDTHKTRLQRDGDAWKAKISLAPGRYEYRFVVDGEWVSDPTCKESVSNDYGSTNSVLVV
jgi:1,4-alpha-glucan branching enzyme